MVFWISLVVVAQAIMAVVALIDRYIVSSGKVGRPLVLAFYVSILSALAIFIFLFSWIPIPFIEFDIPSFSNVVWPTGIVLLYGFIAALTFISALVMLFSSFKLAEASDVVPVVSSVSAVATLILSFYLLDTILTTNFFLGFSFLVVGTFLVAHFRFSKQLLKFTVSAGVLFALHFVTIKLLFEETHFDNAFFWSRMIIAATALLMLLLPNCCHRTIAGEAKQAGRSGLGWILGNKVLAGLAGLLILKAISLGDVAIVQALAGMQFVFLVLFSVLFGHTAPACIGEHCTTKDRIQKIVSVSIIVTGFSLLFI